MITRLTFGGFLIGALIGMAVLASLIAPEDPLIQDPDEANLSPGEGHPLGTDALGRDVMARCVYGARVTLPVAASATLLSCLVGTLFGLAAGAAGRHLDKALMRGVDMLLAFPTLLFLLALAATFRSDTPFMLIVLLGLTTWMPLARLVRAETASLSSRSFVEASRSLGASRARRMRTHMLPNLMPAIVVAATLMTGDVILMESGLSFLGLGVAPPVPSWGDMVREGMQDLASASWISIFPGCALVMAVTAFNLVGIGLRDALAPDVASPEDR